MSKCSSLSRAPRRRNMASRRILVRRKSSTAPLAEDLPLFEAEPSRWEAVRWLNSSPSRKGETFQHYLSKWHRAAPNRHEPFIKLVANQFGITLLPAAN